MKNRIEFLRPRLEGERFDGHAIPLDVLKDWAAFEDLIVETAKWLYLIQHGDRTRVPRGFAKNFSLQLTAVVNGSAIPVLEREALVDLVGMQKNDWFDQARDKVLEAIDAAARGAPVQSILPSNLLSYFDRFGRNLRENETILFQLKADEYNVSYNRDVRKRLVLSQDTVYKTEEPLRGKVSEVNVKNHTFTFSSSSGGLVTCAFRPEISEDVIDSLKVFASERVLIRGLTVRNGQDSILRVEDVAHLEILDELDVPSRLEELAQLKYGWMDGEGSPISKEGLQWLSASWDENWSSELPLPYVYPTLDGGVQAEWSLGDTDASLTVDVTTKVASWVTSKDAFDSEDLTIDLSAADGWRTLSQAVEKLQKQEKPKYD